MKLQLELTEQQAIAVSEALDIFSRLGMGQLEIISEAVRMGTIPSPSIGDDYGKYKQVYHTISEIKELLGFPPGGSYGIHNRSVPVNSRRAYEVKKVIDKAVSENRDPNPKFRGVGYDGLTLRVTENEPKPAITYLKES